MNTFTTWLRRIIIGLLFAVVFVPFVVNNSLFFPFITGKAFLFRFLIELAGLLYVGLLLLESAYRPKKSWVAIALSAFIVILALADAFGVNPSRSFWSNFERMEGLVSYLHLFAYFLLLISVFTDDVWDWFLHAWVGSGVTTALYGVLQMAGKLSIDQGTTRLDATLGNATYLAVYLLFTLFFLVYLAVRNRSDFSKRLFWLSVVMPHVLMFAYGVVQLIDALRIQATYKVEFATVLQKAPYAAIPFIFIYFLASIAIQLLVKFVFRKAGNRTATYIYVGEISLLFATIIFATATRGAILGLLAGAALASFLIVIYEMRRVSAERTIALPIASSLLAVLVVLPLGFLAVRDSSFVQQNPVLVRFASISASEQTTQSRLLIWKMALKGWQEHPILGWGQENFNIVFNKYFNPDLWPQEQWFDRAHSVLFDSLISGGILGLLAYLSLFAALLYVLWKRSRFSWYEKSILTGLIVAYFIHNLVVFDNLVSELVFLTLLGLVHYESTPTEHATTMEVSSTIRDVGLCAAVLVFVLVAYFVEVKPILAAHGIIQAITPPAADHPGDVTQNLNAFKNVIGYDTLGTPEAREQLVLFTVQNVIRAAGSIDPKLANDFLDYAHSQMNEMATDVGNDGRYYFFDGVLMLSSGNSAQAVTLFEKAVSLSPAKQTMMFPLIEAYLVNRNFDKAIVVAKNAYELAPEFDEARLWYAAALITGNKAADGEKLLADKYGSALSTDERILRAYQTIGRYDAIEKAWKAAIDKEPKNTQNYFQLAQVYLEEKRPNDAIALLTDVKKLDPTLQAQIDTAISSIRSGKTSF